MTTRQKAYTLIDNLPEESVKAVIQIMLLMTPSRNVPAEKDKIESRSTSENAAASDNASPKMKAYLRMQQLRKETVKYDISESQREAAMDEKFGAIS